MKNMENLKLLLRTARENRFLRDVSAGLKMTETLFLRALA